MNVDLGQYADAVLSAYAVSLVLIALLLVLTLRKGRRARAELNEVESRVKRDG